MNFHVRQIRKWFMETWKHSLRMYQKIVSRRVADIYSTKKVISQCSQAVASVLAAVANL
jgi:hypothetical protein